MRKILIVDDDPKVRAILRAALSAEGHRILEAEDWDDAVYLLLRYSDLDLVLLDIQMPVVSGDVVYDVVRLYNPKIRIIMSSVHPVDEQKRLVFKADDYYDKSSGVDVLLAKVRNLFGLESLTAGSRA